MKYANRIPRERGLITHLCQRALGHIFFLDFLFLCFPRRSRDLRRLGNWRFEGGDHPHSNPPPHDWLHHLFISQLELDGEGELTGRSDWGLGVSRHISRHASAASPASPAPRHLRSNPRGSIFSFFLPIFFSLLKFLNLMETGIFIHFLLIFFFLISSASLVIGFHLIGLNWSRVICWIRFDWVYLLLLYNSFHFFFCAWSDWVRAVFSFWMQCGVAPATLSVF